MPRRRSGQRGRGNNSTSNFVAPRFDDFDESWLRRIQERHYARLIDLTQIEDRRRWHPNRLKDAGRTKGPAIGLTRPRIVIVPEGHKLARFAPYGARVPLYKVLKRDARTRRRFLDDWSERATYDRYGGKQYSYRPDHLSRRVGFQHPWQVMICVRRKQRREVLFAMGRTGRGGSFKRNPRRTEYSEVRC